jgi:hypothetical protein
MAEHKAQPGRTTPPPRGLPLVPGEPAASWPTRGAHPVPLFRTRGRSVRPRSVTTRQGTTPVPSTAGGTTRGWAAHHPLMDGTTPTGTPTGTASRPALRRWPVVPAVASVPTHTSQGQDEAGGTSQDGARHEAPARTQQERGRHTADTEPTAQHTGRRTGGARAAPSARTSRQAREQRRHGSHITTMPSTCSRVTADCRTPQRRTRPSPTPRPAGAARSAPPRPTKPPPGHGRPPRAMPLNARHRTTPQARAIQRGADAGVDVVPSESTCRRPRRTAAPARRIPIAGSRGEGASGRQSWSGQRLPAGSSFPPIARRCPGHGRAEART